MPKLSLDFGRKYDPAVDSDQDLLEASRSYFHRIGFEAGRGAAKSYLGDRLCEHGVPEERIKKILKQVVKGL